MKHLQFLLLLCALVLCACRGKQAEADSADADSTAVAAVEEEKPLLVEDTMLTNTARRLAAKVDDGHSLTTLKRMDALVKKDMQDLRDSCNFVFYPFAGADFFYPFTLFPDADTFFMLGLEKPGTALRKVSAAKAQSYIRALKIYLNSSFFRTLSMKNDLANEEINGTVPVISMLMAKKDCHIISVRYKELTEDGKLVDTDKYSMIAEIKFFRGFTPRHEQTLYYCSGDISNGGFDKRLETYLHNTLSTSDKYVVTFLKAASYLMYRSHFSKIRSTVLDNSQAVLQDDSGIPFGFFEKNWDYVLYGKYKKPISIFPKFCYQSHLESIYANSGKVRPLDFRIGYNNPSNWMVARKKK